MSNHPVNLAISGAAGRMGKRLIALANDDNSFKITAAVESKDHPSIGLDAGVQAGIKAIEIPFACNFPDEVDVVIDFSHSEGAGVAVSHCLSHQKPLVMATTGLDGSIIEEIHKAAEQIAIVWAPSMSLAVNLTMKLVETAGKALKDHVTGVDVEIIEKHHRFKADAPSGTALKFGEIVAETMGQTHHQHGREGLVGERPKKEIGYHAVRTGDNPGAHTIHFGMLGEAIELNVSASNRDCYAIGALAAAKFVASKPPGLYNMFDVLGLN
jgi:4-hydroxy-tetrahydrodipicolinate reductase